MSRRHPTLSVPQLKAQLRGSSEYDQWSSEVFERYRQVCRNCGEVLRPEAHHIIRFDTLFQEVLDANQASIRRGEFDLVFHAAWTTPRYGTLTTASFFAATGRAGRCRVTSVQTSAP